MFEAAARAAKLTPASTPADVKKGLYALKNETLGGFSSPLNFEPGQPTQVPCTFVMGVKAGALTAPRGDKPLCVPGSLSKYMQLVKIVTG